MKPVGHIMVGLTASLVGIAASGFAPPGAQTTQTLKIYLPREAVVEDAVIKLGAVGIVRGEEAVVQRAASVGVGKFSVAGQQIVVDRPTILAMLGSAGIDAAGVAISGAQSVTVRRNEDVISPERFLAVAQAFLKDKLKNQPVADVVAISRPKPWIMQKTTGDVRLVAREHPYSIPSRPRVWVDVVADGTVQTRCEVAFSLRYERQQFVAAVDIAEGDLITAENVEVETAETSHAPGPKTPPPYGLVAKRAIRKGAVLRDGMVGPEQLPVVVKRRQMVVVKLETPLLLVSSVGEAMDDGKSGDLIRVKVNSGKDARIIVTRVGNDGTVSPVL